MDGVYTVICIIIIVRYELCHSCHFMFIGTRVGVNYNCNCMVSYNYVIVIDINLQKPFVIVIVIDLLVNYTI